MLLVIVLLLALAAFGVFGFFLLFRTESQQRKAEAKADEILDRTFDGRSDVTFELNMATLKYETVITGAKKRGYKLMHQDSNKYGPSMLIFEKAA